MTIQYETNSGSDISYINYQNTSSPQGIIFTSAKSDSVASIIQNSTITVDTSTVSTSSSVVTP